MSRLMSGRKTLSVFIIVLSSGLLSWELTPLLRDILGRCSLQEMTLLFFVAFLLLFTLAFLLFQHMKLQSSLGFLPKKHRIQDATPFPVPDRVGETAVLCSRGHSFLGRLENVLRWAQSHGVANVVVLHCPEEKYNLALKKEVERSAIQLYQEIDLRIRLEGKQCPAFEFIGRKGLLQDNIESLLKTRSIAMVFIGMGMLDYRLEEVKRLRVPFLFLP